MVEYAVVDNGVVVEYRFFDSPPSSLEGKPYRKFLIVEDTNPAFDAALQVKTGPVISVLVNKVTRVWTVRDKTAQEIDNDKDVAINNVDVVAFKVLFNHENRIRVLENKAPITVNQFKTALRAL